MTHSDEIAHDGRIVEITPQAITVEIVSSSACSACHAKGLCGVSESTVKKIQVPFDFGQWSVGEEVNVFLKKTMGYKAVWIAYVAPLGILLAVLLGLMAAGVAELISGLAAIGGVALYYFVIWLLRSKLRNEYTFYIKQK